MKIDAHQHFWAINDTDYVWMTEAHDLIRRDFLPADLQPLLADSGIDGSVAVQARQMVAESQWLLDLAEHNDEILGVVGWVPLLDQAGEPFLERYAEQPKFVGVRHVVHDEPDDDFILREDFGRGIKRLLEYGLVYDILIFEHHLSQTIAFVDRHPGQSFVVDHVANPHIRRDRFDAEWARKVRELASREHVNCKLSGLVTRVDDAGWDLSVLQPYFDTVLEAFGPSRLMFGSDWPVCLTRSKYGSWVESVDSLVAPLSPTEQEMIWGGTAQRIYNLKPPATVPDNHLSKTP